MIVICLLVAASIGSATATEYVHTTATPGYGEVVPIDVALIDNNTMITYPGTPVPPQDCFKHTINFHDFGRVHTYGGEVEQLLEGLVAMKMVDTDSCFVKPTTETYEQAKKLMDAINAGTSGPVQQDTEEWVIPQAPIPNAEVVGKVGENIARFCHGYTVYRMADLINKVKALPRLVRNIVDRSRSKRNNGWCAFCWGCRVNGR